MTFIALKKIHIKPNLTYLFRSFLKIAADIYLFGFLKGKVVPNQRAEIYGKKKEKPFWGRI